MPTLFITQPQMELFKATSYPSLRNLFQRLHTTSDFKFMMRAGIVSIFFLLLLISSCRDPYQPPVIAGQSNLLVVDGFLDGGDSSCMVVLSRSQNLSDSEEPLMEKNANVQLEDDAGNRYSLLEISGGNYSLSNLNLDLQKKYH